MCPGWRSSHLGGSLSRRRPIVSQQGGGGLCVGWAELQVPSSHSLWTKKTTASKFLRSKQSLPNTFPFGCPAGGSVATAAPAAGPTESQISRKKQDARHHHHLQRKRKKFSNFYAWKLLSRRLEVQQVVFSKQFFHSVKAIFQKFWTKYDCDLQVFLLNGLKL